MRNFGRSNLIPILFVLICHEAVFAAGDWNITQLTHNNCDDEIPSISGENIVWSADYGDGYEIFFWDGNSLTQLTDSEDFCVDPSISGSTVVWCEYDGQYAQIFRWDGHTITQITDSPSIKSDPDVSGTNVVWMEMDSNSILQIFFWDGNSTTQVTDGQYGCFQPSISGTNVVWDEFDGDGTHIYFWDGDVKWQLSYGCCDHSAAISGEKVVWQSEHDILYWDGITVNEIGRGASPAISGTNVAWLGWDASNEQIFFWDGNSVTQVTDDDYPKFEHQPSISGTNVVWHAMVASRFQIFLAEKTTLPTTCAEAIAQGYSLRGDIDRDCKVNLLDFAYIANDWGRSLDPNDDNGEKPWLQ